MDSRIICLNSTDAKKLNDDYNSNLFFDIPNIVDENHLISHIEVAFVFRLLQYCTFLYHAGTCLSTAPGQVEKIVVVAATSSTHDSIS